MMIHMAIVKKKKICPSFEYEPGIKRPVNQDLKKDLPPSYVRILTKNNQ